jgi:hypothetical protein
MTVVKKKKENIFMGVPEQTHYDDSGITPSVKQKDKLVVSMQQLIYRN